jgi:hypothetical protein
MNAENIMIDCLGNIKYTTTGIYYKQFNDLISSLKQKGDKVKEFMIFCQPIVENEVGQIAKYFKVEHKVTALMDEHTLILIVKKDFFNTKEVIK